MVKHWSFKIICTALSLIVKEGAKKDSVLPLFAVHVKHLSIHFHKPCLLKDVTASPTVKQRGDGNFFP